MFCLCDFQAVQLAVTMKSVVKRSKKYSERNTDLHEIVNLHEILFMLLLL